LNYRVGSAFVSVVRYRAADVATDIEQWSLMRKAASPGHRQIAVEASDDKSSIARMDDSQGYK
jgi:hypothetical protein